MAASLCLIPPTAHLFQFAKGRTHLILNQLLEDPSYFNFYKARHEYYGDYLILDNGAHEEVALPSTQELVNNAWAVGASEIVMPDKKYDRAVTIELFECCVRDMIGWKPPGRAGRSGSNFAKGNGVTPAHFAEASQPRWMIVPQGRDLPEWSSCLFYMMSRWENLRKDRPRLFTKAPVIGFPMKYTDGVFKFLELQAAFQTLHDFSRRVPIKVHLLGWDRSPWEWVPRLAQAPFVRSVDTAKPFVLALAGKEAGEQVDFPRRQDDYFNLEMTEDQVELAKRNVVSFNVRVGQPTVASRDLRSLPPRTP